MSSTILLPPRAQLCIRYCSNKQQLHVLIEDVDVADIPVIIIVGHVEGRWTPRGSYVLTHGGGVATQ